MKQVLQDLSHGNTYFVDVPVPSLQAGKLRIRTSRSLISSGTERMLVEFGKSSLFKKAAQQPDKVKAVLAKISTDGLLSTIDAVRSKLSQPVSLGYCNVGVVQEIGPGVYGFRAGDRVVSNGPHAAVVNVAGNLCARVPDNVDDESAAFAMLASVGLQGVRLAMPTLGETFAVIGTGLIGLLTIQLLVAHGCRVLAIDFDGRKLAIARELGAETCNLALGEDAVRAGIRYSRERGIDGVLITASTTSNDPVSQAAQMSRQRGRIVLVGVTGLQLSRAEFYRKELSFQVSCSYGPGRYDPAYEEKGLDYPLGYVRWTEKRNVEAVLDMMASGRLQVRPLISHRMSFDGASEAYRTLATDSFSLGIVLEYPHYAPEASPQRVELRSVMKSEGSRPSVGFIGAGNYGSRILMPAFRAADVHLHTLVTASGVNGVVHGLRCGFQFASTDMGGLFEEAAVNTIAIATRHDTHAGLVTAALHHGKHVFVEKPLALTPEQVNDVEEAYQQARDRGQNLHLMVGFNRRFAPHSVQIKRLLDQVREPKAIAMTVNAGAIPAEHWTQDIMVGGGRIIGEACHFIDLMRFFAGAEIVSVQAQRMTGLSAGAGTVPADTVSILLGFADGSIGTLQYLANGHHRLQKERVEIFTGGRVLLLNNYRDLIGHGWPGFHRMRLWRQDKGHVQCVKAFLNAIASGSAAPISSSEIFEVARATLRADDLLRRQ